MHNEHLFVFYTNYPIIDNTQLYYKFLEGYSLRNKWGNTYSWEVTMGSRKRHRFITLDSDEIEIQRNSLFQEILTDITKGKALREIAALYKIIQQINTTKPIVTYKLSIDNKGDDKFTRSEGITHFKSKTGSEYIYNLACHDLISFLSVKGNPRRIKQCPYCNLFFIARDAKRKICYDTTCKNKYHKEDMKLRREKDPVKYI